jgi:hypothetical protein
MNTSTRKKIETQEERAAGLLARAEDAIESLPELAHGVEERLRGFATSTARFVRKNPGLSLAGAFVLGFGVAKLARRR